VQLEPDGDVDIFLSQAAGADLLMDVTGYYEEGGSGEQGPPGPQGPPGVVGDLTAYGGVGPGNPYFFDPPLGTRHGPGFVEHELAGSRPNRAVMPLTGPMVLGGQNYDLQHVQYCVNTFDAGTRVTSVLVTSDTGQQPGQFVVDDTVRTAAGCYDVDATGLESGNSYSLALAFDGPANSFIQFGATKPTFTPTVAIPPFSPSQSSPESLQQTSWAVTPD
jgi:hypothetical protein